MKNIWSDKNLETMLKRNGVAVMPTDTIYGIVGRALSPAVVDRIYNAKRRSGEKPCVILVGDIREIEKFSISLSKKQEEKIENFTEPTSFILDCGDETFSYLHRGARTLAFRVPVPKELRDLLLETGPLVAPSANLEGLPPAQNISEAEKYFGDSVDLYIDGGEIKGQASKIIKLGKNGSITALRE